MELIERQAMANLASKPDLSQRLKKEGYRFNFFQALQLLEEKLLKEKGMSSPLDSGAIRLAPDSSLVFPPCDIKSIKENRGVFELTLTFMGLIGVSSPLPLYFSEYIARHEENSQPLIDFLNIFNHRCYSLFYRAWKKYRFISSFSASEASPISRRIALLAGLDPKRLSDPAYAKLLSYTGIFAGKCRGKSSMTSLLSDFFTGLPVEIQEYQPRWVEIQNPVKMGVDVQLGVNSIAGTYSWDISGKFRVAVGPLPRNLFEKFLPNSDNIKKMKELVSVFLAEPLAYDIEVKLQSSELVPVILGTNNTPLGETSSLGQSSLHSDIKSIVIE
jgi:type VI secretion system protein ImpH